MQDILLLLAGCSRWEEKLANDLLDAGTNPTWVVQAVDTPNKESQCSIKGQQTNDRLAKIAMVKRPRKDSP